MSAKQRLEAIMDFEKSNQRFGTFVGQLWPKDKVIYGAEIGVHQGQHAKHMLKSHPNLVFFGVDMWERHAQENTSYLKSPGTLPSRFADQGLALSWHQDAKNQLEPFGTRVLLFCESSEENSLRWSEKTLDFVYIDADHSYGAVLKDLQLWWPKIKKGGILAGHDYGCFGVSKALYEFLGPGVRHNSAEESKGRCWLMEK